MSEITDEELLAFLNGEGPLDGKWFGEKDERGRAFWWRKYLPVMSNSSPIMKEDVVFRVRDALLETGIIIGASTWPDEIELAAEQLARAAIQAQGTDEGLLRNLLAVIHRDGGHYTAEHGLEKSVEDAMQLSSERIGTDEGLRSALKNCANVLQGWHRLARARGEEVDEIQSAVLKHAHAALSKSNGVE